MGLNSFCIVVRHISFLRGKEKKSRPQIANVDIEAVTTNARRGIRLKAEVARFAFEIVRQNAEKN